VVQQPAVNNHQLPHTAGNLGGIEGDGTQRVCACVWVGVGTLGGGGWGGGGGGGGGGWGAC
jgi:hypothetical protein